MKLHMKLDKELQVELHVELQMELHKEPYGTELLADRWSLGTVIP